MTALLGAAAKVLAMVAAPVALAVLVVGLVVGTLQTATGVQDQSSAQVSRLAAAALALVVAGPWMLRTLGAFARMLWGDLGRFLQ